MYIAVGGLPPRAAPFKSDPSVGAHTDAQGYVDIAAVHTAHDSWVDSMHLPSWRPTLTEETPGESPISFTNRAPCSWCTLRTAGPSGRIAHAYCAPTTNRRPMPWSREVRRPPLAPTSLTYSGMLQREESPFGGSNKRTRSPTRPTRLLGAEQRTWGNISLTHGGGTNPAHRRAPALGDAPSGGYRGGEVGRLYTFADLRMRIVALSLVYNKRHR